MRLWSGAGESATLTLYGLDCFYLNRSYSTVVSCNPFWALISTVFGERRGEIGSVLSLFTWWWEGFFSCEFRSLTFHALPSTVTRMLQTSKPWSRWLPWYFLQGGKEGRDRNPAFQRTIQGCGHCLVSGLFLPSSNDFSFSTSLKDQNESADIYWASSEIGALCEGLGSRKMNQTQLLPQVFSRED